MGIQPTPPSNPQVGDRWMGWMWNGNQWVRLPSSGSQVIVKVFNASGPYMPSPGLTSATVECVGGGGGGGAAQNTVALTSVVFVNSGGGGGAGGYSRRSIPSVLLKGGVNVTIGAGGIGSTAGGQPFGGGTNLGQGIAGGDTMFGALVVAKGGQGGLGNVQTGTEAANNQTAAWGIGGLGGGADVQYGVGIGDFVSPGNGGGDGELYYEALVAGVGQIAHPGIGAAGQFGGQQVSTLLFNAGQVDGTAALANTGAGGNGGIAICAPGSPTTWGVGGAGGSGVCIVTEYVWGDGSGEADCGPTWNVNVRRGRGKGWGPGDCGPGWGGREGQLLPAGMSNEDWDENDAD